MKYELIFDEDVYNNQMDLLFNLAWERKILYYKNSQYLGLFLIIIGAALIYNRPYIFGIGYAFVVFGLSNLVPFVYYYFKIRSKYKKLELAKIEDKDYFKNLKNIKLELTEDSFIISAENITTVIHWEEFIRYLVKKDNLILIAKDYQPYILGEIEVGKENFQQVISFVEEKLKTKSE